MVLWGCILPIATIQVPRKEPAASSTVVRKPRVVTPWGWLLLGSNEKRTNQRNQRVAVRRVSLTLRARGGLIPHNSAQSSQPAALRATLAAHRSSFSSPSRPLLRARGASRIPAGTRQALSAVNTGLLLVRIM